MAIQATRVRRTLQQATATEAIWEKELFDLIQLSLLLHWQEMKALNCLYYPG
jgi:hypothetical protein